jgi:uncharacterized delta-60 repeat protein
MKNILKGFLASFLLLLGLITFAPLAHASYILDQSFGSGGIVQSSVVNTGHKALAVQSDGKIVLGGITSTSGSDVVIARYNTDGSLDTSFGSNGIFTQNIGDTSGAGGLPSSLTSKLSFLG